MVTRPPSRLQRVTRGPRTQGQTSPGPLGPTQATATRRLLAFSPWRTTLYAAALLTTLACGQARNTYWPGASTQSPSATPPPTNEGLTAPEHRERILAPELLADLVATTDQPYPSQGHAPPDYFIQVWVPKALRQAYQTWSENSTLPPGAWIVARHSLRASGPEGPAGASAPVFYLHKDGTALHYGATSPEGYGIPVASEVCQDCHTQARADSVFGAPNHTRPEFQEQTHNDPQGELPTGR